MYIVVFVPYSLFIDEFLRNYTCYIWKNEQHSIIVVAIAGKHYI